MAGDVKLDEGNENWVTVEGSVLRARTADLMLDSPGRRTAGGGPYRRALVHDQNDGLTLNFKRDYPGGVTLNAVTYISPKAPKRTDTEVVTQLRLEPELVIDGGIQFVWDGGRQISGPSRQSVSLQTLIEDLQRQIAELTQRIATLEGQ